MPTSSNPLTVYLDSSDYSVLSDPARTSTSLAEIRRKLEAWTDERRIVCRFSSVHIEEAAPTAREHIAPAQRRFELMRRLCGLQCFKHESILIEEELVRASGKLDSPQSPVQRNDGIWFPPMDWEIQSLEALLRESWGSLSNAARGKNEAMFFNRSGKIRQKMRKEIASKIGQSFITGLGDRFPMTKSAERAVWRYLADGGERGNVIRELILSLADLQLLGQWYVKRWDETSTLTSSLRVAGWQFKDALTTLSKQLSDLSASQSRNEAAKEQEQAFQRIAEEFPKQLARRISMKLDALKDLDVESMSFSWAQTPSIMTITALAVQVSRLTALTPNSSREPRASDMGDISHAAYLPHVDVFRADGFLSSAIKAAKMPLTCTVVAKLTDLSNAIEQRLAVGSALAHRN